MAEKNHEIQNLSKQFSDINAATTATAVGIVALVPVFTNNPIELGETNSKQNLNDIILFGAFHCRRLADNFTK